MRRTIAVIGLLGLFILHSGATASKLTADDLIHNRRTGYLVIGQHYDVPNVGGARASVFNEYDKVTNAPISAGVKMTKQFLENVHKAPCMTTTVDGLTSCMATMWMDFAKGSPFAFMGLDFASNGHVPAGIYDKPHFDIHFYLRTQGYIAKFLNPVSEAGSCPPGFNPKTFLRLHKPIPSKCFPKGYVNIGAATPMMGNHLLNLTSHEFTKLGSFDATWIWGAFDGQISFYEPMITRKTFLDKKSFCGAIPSVPEQFPKAGYHPTTWCYYSYPNGDSYVELRDFVWKTAGCTDRTKNLDGYLNIDPKDVPKGCNYPKAPQAKSG